VRDLSLHILDLIENSIRAQATIVAVTVEQNTQKNILRIVIEDNGPGLSITPEQATDPFYTTKEGKRTGLGLSLFRTTAELAGGTLTLAKSNLGGLAVETVMELNHIDRRPLGDLSATFFTIACTNPKIDLWCRLITDNQNHLVKLSEIAGELFHEKQNCFAIAQKFSEKIKNKLSILA